MSRRLFLNQFSMLGATAFLYSSCRHLLIKNSAPDSVLNIDENERLLFLSATDQLKLLKTNQISASDLCNKYLFRIKQIQSKYKLNSYIHLLQDPFISKTNLNKSKPLSGLQVAIKDDMSDQQFPLTAGTNFLNKYFPSKDSTVVKILKENGANILGKTNVDEMTFGALGFNENTGSVKNPFNLNYSAGGSSAGSAVAVAAGLCSFAIGSDASGSVRIPAASCGIYGFKPSLGKISRNGLIPFVPQKECIGILARDISDIDLIFKILKVPDKLDPLTTTVENKQEKDFSDISKFKFCFFQSTVDKIDKEISTDFFEKINFLKNKNFNISSYSFNLDAEVYTSGKAINYCEQRKNIEKFINTATGDKQGYKKFFPKLQPYLQFRLNLADTKFKKLYSTAMEKKEKLQFEAKQIFKQYDFVILPTIGHFPPLLKGIEKKQYYAEPNIEKYKYPCEFAGLLGLPAIAIPTGLHENGLPLSIQIIGSKNDDENLLAIAKIVSSNIGKSIRPSL